MSVAVEERLLTVREVARVLRVAPATVYRAIDDRRLRAIRLGSGPCARIRVHAHELERLLEEGLR
jgi:excisionase family DNA binding protein